MSTLKVTNIQHGSATNVAMVLDTAGTVKAYSTISVGNVTPSSSGAGITFPATASASSDANTLDDYEEGDWTPTLVFSGGAGTLSYSSRVGKYTKIGRVVYLSGYMVFSIGTASGYLDSISGQPFSSSGTFSCGGGIDNSTSVSGSPVYIVTTSAIYIYMTGTGQYNVINASSFGSGSQLSFATYYNIS